MANIYVNYGNGTSTGYYAVAQWAALTVFSSSSNGGRGDYVRQLAAPSVGNERVFRCTTAGTSLASEPSWTLTKNATTTEVAGPVWTECTGQEADQVSGTWKAPHARLANALASTWGAAGDTFYIGDNHAETQSTAMTVTFPGTAASPNNAYCVLATGTVPPVSADLRATATITTTGASNMTVAGPGYYVYGVAFNCGTGANSAALTMSFTQTNVVLDTCSLNNLATSAPTAGIVFGGAGSGVQCKAELRNTPMRFATAGSGCSIRATDFKWLNTPSAIHASGVPTTLFVNGSALLGSVSLEGVDLSNMAGGTLVSNAMGCAKRFYLKDCKLNASTTIVGTPNHPGGPEVYILRSDSAGTNYRNEKYQYAGTQTVETVLVRTSGATDGVTPLSFKLVTTANAKWAFPFEALRVSIWNPTTSANVTATLEGIYPNATSLPNNDDIWFDAEYLGSSSTPLGSFKSGTKADGLATGSALTASTVAWDSLATARANSTAYSVGDYRKVASNPGRLFYCRTAGTSASSEPGGFASAVDGGDVTDGGATFLAVMRFSMAVTMSSPQPAQAGVLYANIKVGRASSTFYVDPLIVLS